MKALEQIPRKLVDQLYDYLRNSRYELGYFINFCAPKLFLKRIIFTNDRKPWLKLVVLSLVFVVLSVLPLTARGTVLSLEPSGGSYGQSFLVRVMLDTQREEINALESKIIFPKDRLRVIRLEDGESFVDIWPQRPKFSNETGEINFAGGKIGGINASQAIVLGIVFTPAGPGSAFVTFDPERSRVLLNDGKGTPATLRIVNALYSISSPLLAPSPFPTPVTQTQPYSGAPGVELPRPTLPQRAVDHGVPPGAPRPLYKIQASGLTITSTHQHILWSPINTFEVGWQFEPSREYSYLFTNDSRAPLADETPDDPHNGFLRFENLPDGRYTFSLRFRPKGAIRWSDPVFFGVWIDQTPPTIVFASVEKSPQVGSGEYFVAIQAKDNISGIWGYELCENGEPCKTIENLHILGKSLPKKLTVRAIDLAGNVSEMPILRPTPFKVWALRSIGVVLAIALVIIGFILGRRYKSRRKSKRHS